MQIYEHIFIYKNIYEKLIQIFHPKTGKNFQIQYELLYCYVKNCPNQYSFKILTKCSRFL
jgi:hypothetical protein